LTFLPSRRHAKETWSTQFAWCPKCLAETAYVRLHWHLPFVVCCEIHQCWLQNTCSRCGTPIIEIDVIHRQCGKCELKLDQADAVAIPPNDELLHLQSTLMSWFYGQSEMLPCGLPNAPPNILLYVLLGLRYAAQRAGNGWKFHHIPAQIPRPDLDIQDQRLLTTFERGCLYGTAYRALRNWPQGFFTFLDAYRQRPAVREHTGLRSEFGTLYYSWLMRLWKYPDFEFIQTAFNDYLVAHIPSFRIAFSQRIEDYPELWERLGYLDLAHAANFLGISPARLLGSIQKLHFTPYRAPDNTVWFSRQELAELKRQWKNHVTPPEAARLLGVNVEVIRALVVESLLRPVSTDTATKFQRNYIYRSSVRGLIQKLKKHTTILIGMQQEGVSLAEICLQSTSLGIGFSQIIKHICKGSLPAYHSSESLYPLNGLWFEAEAVADLSSQVKEEHEWMNLQETETCLGIGRKALRHLLKVGKLKPVSAFGSKKLFSRKDVLALQDQYTSTQQASTLLNIPTHFIVQLARHGVLTPLSGPGIDGHHQYIFDRIQLREWHEQNVLYREMKTLTPDTSALLRHLKAEQIEPLIKTPRVYIRSEVMKVIASMDINEE
jgi:hypothetical protein